MSRTACLQCCCFLYKECSAHCDGMLHAQVREALESDDVIRRLRAVRQYGRSMSPETLDFPPAVPELPPFRGPMLGDWVPPPAEGVEVLMP